MKNISFIINTSVNTLDHVKLLLKSLKENLYGKEHEILIFVDSDNEGTVQYLKDQKQYFADLKIITHKLHPCVGYSRNNNLLVELAKHDIVSYLQSDMVISKNYDLDVLSELEDDCILSATRIEPPLHGESDKTITRDFGIDPNLFDWENFMVFSETVKEDKTLSYFFAPFTFYKKVWLQVGGYDTLFRRSREDSDLLLRFINSGIKIKQTFKANVYHFSCVSSRGKNWFDTQDKLAQDRTVLQSIADQIELRKFVKKWGNFSHGEMKLKKYDIDLVIKGDRNKSIQAAFQTEPFFSRVWIETDDMKLELLDMVKNINDPANQLLKFSEDDWQNSKKFYNQINYEDIFLIGEPEKYNVKIELDVDSSAFNFLGQETLLNLRHLKNMAEPGEYESGNCKLYIKEFVDITPSSKVNNPKFDMSLLSIE
jgi:GT2 family glycosyltransferase